MLDARGSSTYQELKEDAISKADAEYLGYKVYGVVDAFYKEIQKNLPDFMEEGYEYRILATGHSLGGAVANLFSAVQINEGNPNVFCYTFGAIDSIVSAQPVTEGYEGIHNIYNDFDTFSPSQYGYFLINGEGSKYGKFGRIDSYGEDHRTAQQKEQWKIMQIYEHVNHNMGFYQQDLHNGLVSCEYDYGGNAESDEEAVPEKPQAAPEEWTVRSELSIPGEPESFAAGPIEGLLTDEEDSFLKYIQTYAQVTGAQILCSTDIDPLQLDILNVRAVAALQDSEGKICVLMDLVNTSDQTLSIGIDTVVADGVLAAIEPYHSELLRPSEHLILTIAVNELVKDFEAVAFPLRIYDAEGTELLTTEPISGVFE